MECAFLGTWIVGAGVLVAIPLILIAPLVRCTLQIARAKHVRLARIESVFNNALLEIELQLSDGAYASTLHDQLDQLPQARTLMTSLYGSYRLQTAHRM